MSRFKIETVTKTEQSHRLELTGAGIITLLRDTGHSVARDAVVTFHVPGGGDWSSSDVQICAENPVYIEWKTHSAEPPTEPPNDRLAEAEYLIGELCDHEGAEGWSADLRARLNTYFATYKVK